MRVYNEIRSYFQNFQMRIDEIRKAYIEFDKLGFFINNMPSLDPVNDPEDKNLNTIIETV